LLEEFVVLSFRN